MSLDGSMDMSFAPEAPDNPHDPTLLSGNCNSDSPSVPWLLSSLRDPAVRHTAARRPGLAEIASNWQRFESQCQRCGTCSWRCDLLDDDDEELTAGIVAGMGLRMLADISEEEDLAEGIRSRIEGNTALRNLAYNCFLCSRCTVPCENGVNMTEIMVGYRRLIAYADMLDESSFKLTFTDNQWHLYSVYRAIYGISFEDIPDLDKVEPGTVDTLFFPGCTLLNCAPDIARDVAHWLEKQDIRYCMTTNCCGLALRSSGRTERARDMKFRLRDTMRKVGIRRIVTVCPGCDTDLMRTYGSEFEVIPLPQLLFDHGMKLKVSSKTLACAPYTFLDSCNDRHARFSEPIRKLFSGVPTMETPENGVDAFCCGAGGAVCQHNPEVYKRHARARLDMAEASGASTAISACVTCNYTFADMLRGLDEQDASSVPLSLNYLELIFGRRIDWVQVFDNLENMWTGEYAGWVYRQLT